MSKITRAQNSCAFDKECSHNGKKYDVDIDIAIVNHLCNCESVYSSELRRKAEESLGRKVPFSTFSIHLHRYVLPGFSSEDFGFSTVFKPDFDDLQEAFSLLMKFGLIKPLMIFEGKTRYVWIDERLNDLMQNLRSFHELEDEYFHFRSYFHDKPTCEEKKRLEFFVGKPVARFFINNAELSRFDLKTGLNADIVKRYLKGKEGIDKEIDRQRQKITYITELLKQEYSETIKNTFYVVTCDPLVQWVFMFWLATTIQI
jgi:hypothetical protein